MKKFLGLVFAITFILSGCNSGGGQPVTKGVNKDVSLKVLYPSYVNSVSPEYELHALQVINQHIVSSFNLNHSPILMGNKSSPLYYDCKYQLNQIRKAGNIGDMMVQLYSRHVANCGEYSTLGALTVMHDLFVGGVNKINSNFELAFVGHAVPGDHAFAVVVGKSGQRYILDPMFQMVKPIQSGDYGLFVSNYWKIDGVFFHEDSQIVPDYDLTSALKGALLHNPRLLKLMEREAVKYNRKKLNLPIIDDNAIDHDYKLNTEGPISISSLLGL